ERSLGDGLVLLDNGDLHQVVSRGVTRRCSGDDAVLVDRESFRQAHGRPLVLSGSAARPHSEVISFAHAGVWKCGGVAHERTSVLLWLVERYEDLAGHPRGGETTAPAQLQMVEGQPPHPIRDRSLQGVVRQGQSQQVTEVSEVV